MSSNVVDAIALVSSRHNYFIQAKQFEAEASELEKDGKYPLTARVFRRKAEICRRAAEAELRNPK
jgi:hypothetical protein